MTSSDALCVDSLEQKRGCSPTTPMADPSATSLYFHSCTQLVIDGDTTIPKNLLAWDYSEDVIPIPQISSREKPKMKRILTTAILVAATAAAYTEFHEKSGSGGASPTWEVLNSSPEHQPEADAWLAATSTAYTVIGEWEETNPPLSDEEKQDIIETEVVKIKTYRRDIDAIIQKIRELPPSRAKSMAVTKLEEGVMWLGMSLKEINDANPGLAGNPYPSSKDPSTGDKIEPTADGLKFGGDAPNKPNMVG